MKDCQTKYRIMETAADLIWRSSYDSVGVGEICKKARVNKGSFYHFFPSKEALAVAALEEHWQRFQPTLDQIFSPQKDPVQRLLDYCDYMLKLQTEKKDKYGFVSGCPYTTVGMEQCSQSPKIRKTAEQLLEKVKKYFISAVRDAAQEGLIETADPKKKADELYTYYIGAATQARIYNDLKRVRALKGELKDILGIKERSAKA
jgi:TetR/AcrR family transcriptional repressor of nem operon